MEITKAATETYAVRITTSPRTFPRRSTDYSVSIIDRDGAVVAKGGFCSSEAGARKLANIAWSNLRAGVAPAKVWNV